jgi:hypothetical protein
MVNKINVLHLPLRHVIEEVPHRQLRARACKKKNSLVQCMSASLKLPHSLSLRHASSSLVHCMSANLNLRHSLSLRHAEALIFIYFFLFTSSVRPHALVAYSLRSHQH